MRKKKFHISLRVLIGCCILGLLPLHLLAQNPSITVGSSDIGNEVSTTLATFSAPCLASIVPYVKLRASGDLSDGLGHTISLTKLRIKITQINGTLITLFPGSNVEITPTTSDQTLYSALAAVASGNNITLLYRIPQSEMNTLALYAGIYTTTLTFTTPGSTACLGTLTTTRTLTVTVGSFIVVPATTNISLNINSLSYFRTTTITANHDVTATISVPHNIEVKAGSSTLSYTPVAANSGASINTNVNKITVQPTNPPTGTGVTVSLSNSVQNLLTSGIVVPTANVKTTNVQYSISPANLKAGFCYAGTYTGSLTYDVFDTHTAPPTVATAQTISPSFTATVADMSELSVNNSNVTLTFGNAAAYVAGRDTDITNHLTVSETTPYDVSVKASTANVTSGANNIPVSIVKVGAAAGQTGVTQVNLSNAYQVIINGASPAIDRNVSIKYSISSASVSSLLGKPAGDYTTTVTYSITAH